MKVFVRNETVRRNVELFKKLIERQVEKRLKGGLKSMHAYINCATGELFFAERTESHKRNWKLIHFYLDEEGELLVVGGDSVQFPISDLVPSAYQAMIDTVKVYNLVLKSLRESKNVEQLSKKLNAIEVGTSKDVVHEAWHQVNRLQAEKLLKGQLKGTFLFRKDEYAAILEMELLHRLHIPLKCFTLTYLGPRQKVMDRTIVKREDLWLFYDDDPSLEGRTFRDIHLLLDSLEGVLKYPLLNG
jgi:hypothetical protein